MSSVSSASPSVDIKKLRPIRATPENIKGYGWLLGPTSKNSRDDIDFYDEVDVFQPAEFHSNEDTCLNVVTFRPRELRVRWMEYHVKHTQTFVPLAGKPFFMVLGKATLDADNKTLPNKEEVQAFYFDGSAGLVMDVGTWHEVPFPAEGETHFVCICTNETNDNLEEQGADGECDGGDLTKRNIAKQFGYTYEIDASDI